LTAFELILSSEDASLTRSVIEICSPLQEFQQPSKVRIVSCC